jgi:hypothetical protein
MKMIVMTNAGSSWDIGNIEAFVVGGKYIYDRFRVMMQRFQVELSPQSGGASMED